MSKDRQSRAWLVALCLGLVAVLLRVLDAPAGAWISWFASAGWCWVLIYLGNAAGGPGRH